MATNTPFDSDIPTEGKPGTYTPDYTVRPAAPVILFDTSAPTDLDPDNFCPCGMLLIDCEACMAGGAA